MAEAGDVVAAMPGSPARRRESARTTEATATAEAKQFQAGLTDPQNIALKEDLDALLMLKPSQDRANTSKGFIQFEELFAQYLAEKGTKVDWGKIRPPPPEMIVSHGSLSEPTAEELAAATNKLAIVKLNGGLGTSMGCKGPKSVIKVRNELSFLDLTVMQVQNMNAVNKTQVPLLLMNSFNTDADTEVVIRKYGHKLDIKRFNQSQFPRLHLDSLAPAAKSFEDLEAWYPPGHGDFYRSLESSGMLDHLEKIGAEYLFVSNIDNLGAVVDTKILKHFHENPGCEFIMEVTDKTRADVKGGTLIDYEGQIRLLEIAQVSKENVDEFKSITKFRIFNTNSIWLKVAAIRRVLGEGKMHMEVIENKKSMGGADVIQLEQAIGSAIKNFNGAIGINVPRSRFLPVKQSRDLLLVMSDLFTQKVGQLMINSRRVFPGLPLVKLGSHFKKVADFLARFESMPSILELDHLTVQGDVCFGRNVTLKGTVIIIANEGEHIDIPHGALLENKIVTGNLRILDH